MQGTNIFKLPYLDVSNKSEIKERLEKNMTVFLTMWFLKYITKEDIADKIARGITGMQIEDFVIWSWYVPTYSRR